MIYTIGHKVSYDKGIKELGYKFRKVGKTEGYKGGIVFKTYEDAATFLDYNEIYDYDVYGLLADWDNDTKDNHLLHTSQIIKTG